MESFTDRDRNVYFVSNLAESVVTFGGYWLFEPVDSTRYSFASFVEISAQVAIVGWINGLMLQGRVRLFLRGRLGLAELVGDANRWGR